MYLIFSGRTGRFIQAAILCGLVLFVSWGLLTPDPLAVVRRSPFSILTTISDLLMHCGVYFILSAAALALTRNSSELRVHLVVWLLLITHALGTEYLQQFVPRRTCDPLDALANLTGIACGALALRWLCKPFPEKAEPTRSSRFQKFCCSSSLITKIRAFLNSP